MTKTPEEQIAALRAELAETQNTAATMLATMVEAMGATSVQRAAVADEYQAIADGRMRSRVTAIIARKVAERLRER